MFVSVIFVGVYAHVCASVQTYLKSHPLVLALASLIRTSLTLTPPPSPAHATRAQTRRGVEAEKDMFLSVSVQREDSHDGQRSVHSTPNPKALKSHTLNPKLCTVLERHAHTHTYTLNTTNAVGD